MTNTVDPAEIAKFEAMAQEWWDPNGKFKPLHMLNPVRLDYITSQICAEFGRDTADDLPFDGLSLIDVGCGGGLVAEPMARLGAKVTGIDAGGQNIPVAELHAESQGLEIDYRHTAAETLVETGAQYDVVLALEIIEHVADPVAFLTACRALTKPDGLLICSTINRNLKSYGALIIGAEYILNWLPKGTHEWSKFITPEELFEQLRMAGVDPVDKKGFVFNPIRWDWSLSDRDLSVNYITSSINKP